MRDLVLDVNADLSQMVGKCLQQKNFVRELEQL